MAIVVGLFLLVCSAIRPLSLGPRQTLGVRRSPQAIPVHTSPYSVSSHRPQTRGGATGPGGFKQAIRACSYAL